MKTIIALITALTLTATAQNPPPPPPVAPPAGFTEIEWDHEGGIGITYGVYQLIGATWTRIAEVPVLEFNVPKTPGTNWFYVTAMRAADGVESLPSNVLAIEILPGPVLRKRASIQSSTDLEKWTELAAVEVAAGDRQFFRLTLADVP